jgi:hypothetical protein
MKVYARVDYITDTIVSSAEQLSIHVTVGFALSGVAYNNAFDATVGSPNLLTGLLVDNALRTAVKNFVNTNYGTNIVSTDVIMSGGFNLPLL